MLDIPKYGCINVQASLLHSLRGAAPINWSIINGDTKSGVTTMLMDIGLDTGDMLLKDEVSITDDMNAGELNELLSKSGAKLLIVTIKMIENNTITPIKQDDSKHTYAALLNKEIAVINWNETEQNVQQTVNG